MTKTFLYISILVLITSCNLTVKPGAGLYFYHPFADGATDRDTFLTPVSFLELRSDGSYTQDFGHFDYGTWMLKDWRLYLTNQHRRTYIYRVLLLGPKEMDMALDSGRTGHFYVHAMPSGRPEKDPFSTMNNQWRIPALHRESDAQIRQRLLNHCQFWEAYFSWARDKEDGAIEITDIPSPLKIYGNGFGLKHYDNLPKAWQSYFFDTADCHKADTMIKHTFRRHDIAWPETNDDLKKLISGTHQLQDWLK